MSLVHGMPVPDQARRENLGHGGFRKCCEGTTTPSIAGKIVKNFLRTRKFKTIAVVTCSDYENPSKCAIRT
jgi:hypothetical protein